MTGDTKATGSDLLDGGTTEVAVGVAGEAIGIFAAFAGVGFTSKPIHGDRKGFVSLFTD